VVFCDADDVVEPTWVESMARAAKTCDAVGGTITKDALNPTSTLLPGTSRTDDLRTWADFLSFAPGANCGVRAALFHELNGFDETYAAGCDDTEFFWRLQLAGHRVCFVPEAIVNYRERGTLRGVAYQFLRYGMSDVRLFRDFRGRGMPRSSPTGVAKSWAGLLLRAPWYWVDRARRRQWVKSVARRVGRVVGSVRFRALYL
jgi:GT2 family glycosyltransferase